MKYFLLILLVVLVFSCGKDDAVQDGPIKLSGDSKDAKFLEMQDSILRSYNQAMKLINRIDDELTKIDQSQHPVEGQSYEQSIIQKIEYLKFQLTTRNNEIADLEKKMRAITSKNKDYATRIKTLESIIDEKNELIQTQNVRISDLEKKLGVVIQERDLALEGKKFAEEQVINTTNQLTSTTNQLNTAFYVIGTEDELEKKGIIQKKGKGFLGIGGQFVPNEELDMNLFNKIDIFKDTEFPIKGNYSIAEIVSTHNRKFLKLETGTSGSSFIKILNPDAFWKTDKKLIIIIEEN